MKTIINYISNHWFYIVILWGFIAPIFENVYNDIMYYFTMKQEIRNLRNELMRIKLRTVIYKLNSR